MTDVTPGDWERASNHQPSKVCKFDRAGASDEASCDHVTYDYWLYYITDTNVTVNSNNRQTAPTNHPSESAQTNDLVVHCMH